MGLNQQIFMDPVVIERKENSLCFPSESSVYTQASGELDLKIFGYFLKGVEQTLALFAQVIKDGSNLLFPPTHENYFKQISTGPKI